MCWGEHRQGLWNITVFALEAIALHPSALLPSDCTFFVQMERGREQRQTDDKDILSVVESSCWNYNSPRCQQHFNDPAPAWAPPFTPPSQVSFSSSDGFQEVKRCQVYPAIQAALVMLIKRLKRRLWHAASVLCFGPVPLRESPAAAAGVLWCRV